MEESKLEENELQEELLDDSEAIDDEFIDKPTIKRKPVHPIVEQFEKDLIRIYYNPFWMVTFLLGILLIALFLLLFLELNKEQQYERLKGYVLLHHSIPEWHKGKVPKEITEIITIHKQKTDKEAIAQVLVPPDPRINNPTLAEFYPGKITNDDIKLILTEQNIGEVTKAGVLRSELINLSGLDLSAVNFKYLKNFVMSDLRYVVFNGASSKEMLFRSTSLEHAQFVETDFGFSNFSRARLDYSNFYLANISYSNFDNALAPKAHFMGSRAIGSSFNEAIFKLADFSEAILDTASIRNANFEGVSFRDASLISVDFRGSNLGGASFVNANLQNADLSNCNLEAANFEGANLEGAILTGANITASNFKNTIGLTYDQLVDALFLPSAINIDPAIIPKKQSWKDRINPPIGLTVGD